MVLRILFYLSQLIGLGGSEFKASSCSEASTDTVHLCGVSIRRESKDSEKSSTRPGVQWPRTADNKKYTAHLLSSKTDPSKYYFQALLEITSGFHLTIRTKMTTTQPLKYNDWLAPEEISVARTPPWDCRNLSIVGNPKVSLVLVTIFAQTASRCKKNASSSYWQRVFEHLEWLVGTTMGIQAFANNSSSFLSKLLLSTIGCYHTIMIVRLDWKE